jgi:hypothetical protein
MFPRPLDLAETRAGSGRQRDPGPDLHVTLVKGLVPVFTLTSQSGDIYPIHSCRSGVLSDAIAKPGLLRLPGPSRGIAQLLRLEGRPTIFLGIQG